MELLSNVWQKLVNTWCIVDGKYGLTIPYLIEAERRFANRDEFDISELLKEASESDHIYIISYCSDLEEYIIGLHKTEYPEVHSLKKFGTLAMNDNRLEKLDTLSDLHDILDNMYRKKIDRKLVSKNYYTKLWSDFDEDDKNDIKRALN
ncbi:hypothetical protein CPT03_03190 [Pedobacter ginsengisoli]|uniref:Uncharacterized protein n=1 Tax=Pedobacter ginsengisoli TaxID=363852 RepID=A0A2D1U1Q2_9SPHI|nr:hypothetical protein [Pedobacter ginsengisoli]ATP55535.1 hypothetical protein CPT03_03190 [Pedobacter ginsengisoli]